MLHACERELAWLDMSINLSKSCCLRVGPRCDVKNCISVTSVTSLSGHCLLWVAKMRYLGIYIDCSKSMKCSLDECKKKFYRAANGIFGMIGRTVSEEVILKLISSKCIPILLYGLESLSLYKYQLNSLDFTVNRFFRKLFRTTDMRTVATLQDTFGFALPSVWIARRTDKFIKELTGHALS